MNGSAGPSSVRSAKLERTTIARPTYVVDSDSESDDQVEVMIVVAQDDQVGRKPAASQLKGSRTPRQRVKIGAGSSKGQVLANGTRKHVLQPLVFNLADEAVSLDDSSAKEVGKPNTPKIGRQGTIPRHSLLNSPASRMVLKPMRPISISAEPKASAPAPIPDPQSMSGDATSTIAEAREEMVITESLPIEDAPIVGLKIQEVSAVKPTAEEAESSVDDVDECVLTFSPAPESPMVESPIITTVSIDAPIEIVDSDDSEEEWLSRRRKVQTPVQKRIVVSDSEDEDQPREKPTGLRRVLESDSEEANEEEEPEQEKEQERPAAATRRPNRLLNRRPAALKFLDLSAGDDEGEEEDDDDDDHGSLKDFIVDDDEDLSVDESDEDGARSDEDESPRRERRDKRDEQEKTDKRPPVVYEIDDTSEEDDILHYSPPRRPVTLPDLSSLTLDDSPPRPLTPPRPRKGKQATPRLPPASAKSAKNRKEWETERTRIAQDLFDELDKKVFEGKLGATGRGARIEWNNRLLTTAGTANSSRTRKPDGTVDEVFKITLSMKVLTDEESILSTVAHEMCHLACWIISNERKNPHGKVFKSWGRKVMRARKDIEVTTRHNYQIEYKYEWRCVNDKCGKIYRRHSKSIDITRQACGSCRNRLEPLFETKTSAFQSYLKQNMAHAKAALPNASHGEVMRALSTRWTEAGEAADHTLYWKERIAAMTNGL